jgi:hypothetical protein
MHAHADLAPDRHASFPSKRLVEATSVPVSVLHTLDTLKAAVGQLKQQRYVTDEQNGRRYWVRNITLELIEVNPEGDVVD